LEVKNQFETSQIIQPIFISSEGENFSAFAQSVWDKLIQENDYFDCIGVLPPEQSKNVFASFSKRAEETMQQKYEDCERSVFYNTDKVKANKEKSYSFQQKQLNRIGIENIRQSRLNRLQKEWETWNDSFLSAQQIIPSFTCLMIINIVNE